MSYNVPPYGRAGLYLELANLKDLIGEFRMMPATNGTAAAARQDLREAIWALCHRSGRTKDVPLIRTAAAAADDGDSEGGEVALDAIPSERADAWILTEVSDYLAVLQDRLFSSGLHVLGREPTDEHLMSYLKAYFGDDRISDVECANIIASCRRQDSDGGGGYWEAIVSWFQTMRSSIERDPSATIQIRSEAVDITRLLLQTTQELDSVINIS